MRWRQTFQTVGRSIFSIVRPLEHPVLRVLWFCCKSEQTLKSRGFAPLLLAADTQLRPDVLRLLLLAMRIVKMSQLLPFIRQKSDDLAYWAWKSAELSKKASAASFLFCRRRKCKNHKNEYLKCQVIVPIFCKNARCWHTKKGNGCTTTFKFTRSKVKVYIFRHPDSLASFSLIDSIVCPLPSISWPRWRPRTFPGKRGGT